MRRCIETTRRFAQSSSGVPGTIWGARPLVVARFQCPSLSSQDHRTGDPVRFIRKVISLTITTSFLILSARAFISADGKRFEWRRNRENPSSYDVRFRVSFLSAFSTNCVATAICRPKHADSVLSTNRTIYRYRSLTRPPAVYLHIRLVIDRSAHCTLCEPLDRSSWGIAPGFAYFSSCFQGYYSAL